jgi:hypothetical protein
MRISLKVVPILLLLIGCVANQEAGESPDKNNNPSQAATELKKAKEF